MGLRIAVFKKVNKGGKVPISSGLRAAGVTNEGVLKDSGPVVDGQVPLRIEQELGPDRLELFRELCHPRQTIGSQRCDPLADPVANTVSCDRQSSTSAKELLSSKLVIGAGSTQIGDQFVAA
jgi:hypothetical protein